MSVDIGLPTAGRTDTPTGEAHAALRLTVVEFLGTGGMIHYAYELCDALSRAGADVTLLTSTDYELDALPHSFRVDKRFRLWPHHDPTRSENHRRSRAGQIAARGQRALRRLARAIRFVLAWLVLLRALDRRTADVVQFGTLRFPFESLFLRLLARRGYVLADICHEPELRERRPGAVRALVARASGGTYAQFGTVFLHGAYNRDLFCRLYPDVADRAVAIRIGSLRIFETLARDGTESELRRRYGLDSATRAIVYFGHLVQSKGVDVLVRAHALVYPETGTPLIIAGYPSKLFDVAELVALIRELNVTGSTILDLRYVPSDEVAALMSIATMVALPYRSASQSAALQVAYTFGRPVVATRVGGLPEAVEDGRSGLLVAPESTAELAEAIKAIICSPERAAEMGTYARKLALGKFSWDSVAAEMLSTYEPLVDRRAS